MGQLAPAPDLTRQCAFDLRSRLAILALYPDGVRFILSYLRGFRASPRLSCRMIEPGATERNRPFGLVPEPRSNEVRAFQARCAAAADAIRKQPVRTIEPPAAGRPRLANLVRTSFERGS